MQKTTSEIFEYISRNASPEKFTMVLMKSGVTHIGRFIMDNLMNEPIENKWVFIQGGSNTRININGDDIRGIKIT